MDNGRFAQLVRHVDGKNPTENAQSSSEGSQVKLTGTDLFSLSALTTAVAAARYIRKKRAILGDFVFAA
jgi:hypothetical protein